MLVRLAGVEEAGLDAAEGAEHPAMLAPDLPLELIPLAGDHMEDILQTCRARDIGMNRRGRKRERTGESIQLSLSLEKHPDGGSRTIVTNWF